MDSTEKTKDSPLKGWFDDCNTPTAKELVFLVQLITILIVIIACIFNLSFNEQSSNLWTVLLSSSIGYILPNPRLNNNNNTNNRSLHQNLDEK